MLIFFMGFLLNHICDFCHYQYYFHAPPADLPHISSWERIMYNFPNSRILNNEIPAEYLKSK